MFNATSCEIEEEDDGEDEDEDEDVSRRNLESDGVTEECIRSMNPIECHDQLKSLV